MLFQKISILPPQKGFPGEVGVGGMGFGRPKKSKKCIY